MPSFFFDTCVPNRVGAAIIPLNLFFVMEYEWNFFPPFLRNGLNRVEWDGSWNCENKHTLKFSNSVRLRKVSLPWWLVKDSGSMNKVKRNYFPVQGSYSLVQKHSTGTQRDV